jgi:hypothetical protein
MQLGSAEYTVNYKGHWLVFACDAGGDLPILDNLLSKLVNATYKKSNPEQSKQSPHLYFYLDLVGERLSADREGFMSTLTQRRGEQCLVSKLINCVNEKDQGMVLALKAFANPEFIWLFSTDYKTFTNTLTADTVQMAIQFIDKLLASKLSAPRSTAQYPAVNSKPHHDPRAADQATIQSQQQEIELLKAQVKSLTERLETVERRLQIQPPKPTTATTPPSSFFSGLFGNN